MKTSVTGLFSSEFYITGHDYEKKEVQSYLEGIAINCGLKINLYENANQDWSLGVLLAVGVGVNIEIKDAYGLQSYYYSFPEYMYVKKNFHYFSISLLGGYRIVEANIPYKNPTAGIILHLDENRAVHLWGTVASHNYYTYYTNNTYHPSLKIQEFGISFIRIF
ncbi:hypothetical protein OAA06_01090 [bacterium]|nr:hypothetical protein [bacterium]